MCVAICSSLFVFFSGEGEENGEKRRGKEAVPALSPEPAGRSGVRVEAKVQILKEIFFFNLSFLLSLSTFEPVYLFIFDNMISSKVPVLCKGI